MPVLVAHRQLLTRPDNDVLTEGDAAREGVEKVEADAAQPVPRLPLENQQEQQPQQVLRKLPQVKQNIIHCIHENSYLCPKPYVTPPHDCSF